MSLSHLSLSLSLSLSDEGQVDEEKLQHLASELLEKWSTLKEVFRIPKRAAPVSHHYCDGSLTGIL